MSSNTCQLNYKYLWKHHLYFLNFDNVRRVLSLLDVIYTVVEEVGLTSCVSSQSLSPINCGRLIVFLSSVLCSHQFSFHVSSPIVAQDNIYLPNPLWYSVLDPETSFCTPWRDRDRLQFRHLCSKQDKKWRLLYRSYLVGLASSIW